MKEELKKLLSAVGEGGRAEKAQTVHYYWKGGTPGVETEWTIPANWYNRKIPGWFDTVVISPSYTTDHFYPIIKSFINDIARLVIEPKARICIAKPGKLCVDGLGRVDFGIWNQGLLSVWGELTIQRTRAANLRNNGTLANFGSVALDMPAETAIQAEIFSKVQNHGELLHLSF